MLIDCTNKLIYRTNKVFIGKLIVHETAILLHTSNRGKKGTREGKKGTREGKKGTREGKKGARECKRGAAPFYFGLAGTLLPIFWALPVVKKPRKEESNNNRFLAHRSRRLE